MIIAHIQDGIGNQLFRYAMGRRLAYKLNTEFKIDNLDYDVNKSRQYILNQFDIKENFATSKEIEYLKKLHEGTKLGYEKKAWHFMPEALAWPDDLYLFGAWEDERYFVDIADIIRKEFTFKQALGTAAQSWKEKILTAECAVSLHFRQGDFAFHPLAKFSKSNAILPPDYYYECVNRLKSEFKNITLFIFSNNLQWIRENFHPGVPMEFVEGEDLTDVEELHLMSLCKHNIIANSTFSWWGAWLNKNPDKKVFMPIPSSDAAKAGYRFSAERNENSPLDSDKWIRVPFDLNKQPDIMMRPIFSLLLVVNNDAATLNETLGSIFAQDYKYYELIIIDNASTDGSGKLCRQVAQARDNVMLIKLWDKVSDGAAYNKALDIAQGQFVLFLKGNDRMLSNTLTQLYMTNERFLADVVNSVTWLREDEHGGINLANRKFTLETDAAFRGLQGALRGKFDKPTLFKIFATNEAATPLATKMFKREFLADKRIRFNEQNGDEVRRSFAIDSMLQADEMIFTPNVYYIAPQK